MLAFSPLQIFYHFLDVRVRERVGLYLLFESP